MKRSIISCATTLSVVWFLRLKRSGHCRRVNKQQGDGSGKYLGKADTLKQNYSLLETFRSLRVLVEQYGFTCTHPVLKKATDYIFSYQTAEGDIRGILGNQYMPYYHGAILELLVKAGCTGDSCVISGLDWPLSMRQEDGGWIVLAQIRSEGRRKPTVGRIGGLSHVKTFL